FHVFALEWTPKEMKWSVDGVARYVTTSDIYRKPVYLALQTSVGGIWLRNPDQNSVFPQYHDIDYVRVYRRAADSVPPSIKIVSPQDEQIFTVVKEITLRAAVADADPKTTKVEFFRTQLKPAEGPPAKLREYTSPPYEYKF